MSHGVSLASPHKHIYRAYELNIRADFPIPEFPPGAESSRADVLIRHGTVPTELVQTMGRRILYQATANQFLLTMKDIARYLVQNGNEIIVEPVPNALDSDVRVFLLGSCIGALLHQRGLLALHASAFYTPRGAVLFTGKSGAGKSTLLGELLRRGYKMMVDDVCALTVDSSDMPIVLPGYPRTRLWSDAAQKLEQDITQMERTRPALEKYERQAAEQFWNHPAPLRRIYLLSTSDKDELALTPQPRLDTFSIVLNNTYRQTVLDGLQMRAAHFHLVSTVAKKTNVILVTRPSHPFRLTELAHLIEQDLAQA